MKYTNVPLKKVKQRFKGQYVDVTKQFDYTKQEWLYTVQAAYKTIRENTTLAEDIETPYEYRR